MDTRSPLNSLVIRVDDFDEEQLAELLEGRVNIDREGGDLHFAPGVHEEYTIRQRAVLALLGQAAQNCLGDDPEGGLTPKEIEELLGVNGNSLRPALKKLADGGVAVRDEEGQYSIPPYALDEAADELGGE